MLQAQAKQSCQGPAAITAHGDHRLIPSRIKPIPSGKIGDILKKRRPGTLAMEVFPFASKTGVTDQGSRFRASKDEYLRDQMMCLPRYNVAARPNAARSGPDTRRRDTLLEQLARPRMASREAPRPRGLRPHGLPVGDHPKNPPAYNPKPAETDRPSDLIESRPLCMTDGRIRSGRSGHIVHEQ